MVDSDDDTSTEESISAIELDLRSPPSESVHDFKDSNSPHDRILVVGKVNLYVLLKILQKHCDYFKALFGENFNESQKKKIVLHDVKLEEFLMFLNHLYAVYLEVTVDNVVILMRMAERFLSPAILSKCTNFATRYGIPTPLGKPEAGDTAFHILEIAIRLDLKDIKEELSRNVFCRGKYVRCKVCKEETSCAKDKYHTDYYGLFLPNNHICIRYRDYIMTLEPTSVTFILKSLLESAKLQGEDDDSYFRTEKELLDEYNGGVGYSFEEKDRTWINTLPVNNFTDSAAAHDCVIIAENQQHYVDRDIVCTAAKWFSGRFEVDSELTIPDISSAHLCFFLHQIYGTHENALDELFYLLLDLADRFEAPQLFDKAQKYMHREVDILDGEGTDNGRENFRVAELAVKYELRNAKKL